MDASFLADVRKILETLKRPPILSVSEWADTHRQLSREASAEPGRWQTERTPYLREPMDCLTDRRVETVTLMYPYSKRHKLEVD
jgi:phage terminase large subunit GpA-like protein